MSHGGIEWTRKNVLFQGIRLLLCKFIIDKNPVYAVKSHFASGIAISIDSPKTDEIQYQCESIVDVVDGDQNHSPSNMYSNQSLLTSSMIHSREECWRTSIRFEFQNWPNSTSKLNNEMGNGLTWRWSHLSSPSVTFAFSMCCVTFELVHKHYIPRFRNDFMYFLWFGMHCLYSKGLDRYSISSLRCVRVVRV